MRETLEKTVPLAVWVESINAARSACFYNGYICDKSADVRAQSPDRIISMELETNPLTQELLKSFERMWSYGFTVVQVPENWRDQYSRPQGWCDRLVNSALENISQSQDVGEVEGSVAMYDEALSKEILSFLIRASHIR